MMDDMGELKFNNITFSKCFFCEKVLIERCELLSLSKKSFAKFVNYWKEYFGENFNDGKDICNTKIGNKRLCINCVTDLKGLVDEKYLYERQWGKIF